MAQTELPDDSTCPNDFADFQFMIVAMWRLRRFVEQLVVSVPTTFSSLNADLAEFDNAIPALKRLRDVDEHIDEYNLDVGRRSSGKSSVDPVYRQQLQTFGFGAAEMKWLGERFVYDDAFPAALRLSRALRMLCGSGVGPRRHRLALAAT